MNHVGPLAAGCDVLFSFLGALQLDGNAVYAVVRCGAQCLVLLWILVTDCWKDSISFGDFVMRLALSMAMLALSVSQLAASSSIYVEPASVPPNQFPCSKGYRGRAATGRNRGVGVTRKLASKR